MTEIRRSVAARLGVTLLNLLAPGLGLLRAGELRRGLSLYGTSVAAFLFFIAILRTTDHISFAVYAILVMFVLAVSLIVYVLALVWTWRNSRQIIKPPAVWSRWYAIIAAALAAFAISWGLSGIARSEYHNFYLPAESMEPTLDKNDRIVASMRPPKSLQRGDLVLVKGPNGATYVKRVAGLPGDRIGLRNAVVFINGAAVPQRPIGVRPVSYAYMQVTKAHLYSERFPGEVRPHLIQDLGPGELDNFPEVTVAPGHVFTLGDNRDDSADSRVPRAFGGLEQVPIGDVIGRPLFFYWPKAKMGQRIE